MSEPRLSWTSTGIPNQVGPHAGVRALLVDDIDMVFQPIVDAATGQLFAHEALVRCRLPQYASPQLLFLAAEKEGACGYLGRIIRQRTFERCENQTLFVNVHPDELSQRWLVRPDDPMYFHDREIYLEITESAAFTHYDLCMSVLKDVCARSRVHLVVDDYGAGHSNLARILDLNPEIVKLDGALIRGIDKDRRRQIMVRHMVALCIDLGARVVAECVETIDELKAVRDQGVHFAQGFVLARPAFPPPEATFPLARRPLPPSAQRPPPPKPIARILAPSAAPKASEEQVVIAPMLAAPRVTGQSLHPSKHPAPPVSPAGSLPPAPTR